MPNPRQYYEDAIAKATNSAEHYRKEAMEHLEAIPHLSHDEAMDSLDVIDKALLELRWYINRLDVLTKLLVKVR